MKTVGVIFAIIFASVTFAWGQAKDWRRVYYEYGHPCGTSIDDGFGGVWELKSKSRYIKSSVYQDGIFYLTADYTLRRPSYRYIHPNPRKFIPRKKLHDVNLTRLSVYQRQDSILDPAMWAGAKEVFKEYLPELSESGKTLLFIYLWLDPASGRVKFIEYDFGYSSAWDKGKLYMRNIPPKVLTEYEDFLKKNIVFDLSDIIEFTKKDKKNGYYLYTYLDFNKIYNDGKP